MASDNEWGPGDISKARHVGWTRSQGGGALEIFSGEHKHSYSENRWYARDDHGNVYEFDGHVTLIDVKVQSYNYLKESELSGDEIRKGGSCEIIADGETVFEFFFRDPLWALLRAHHLIGELREHPSDVLSKSGRERLRGRKIYYHGTPAVIGSLILDQGCVIIEAEPGHTFPKRPWNDDDDDEWSTSVKDEILSPHIWWFREEPTP